MLTVNTCACFSYSNSKVIASERQFADVFVPCRFPKGRCFSLKMGFTTHQLLQRSTANAGVWAVVVSGVDGVEVSSVKEFSFTATSSDKDDKLKIPKEILLEILGPSKVYHQVIKKVINIAIAKYVAKEGLKVGKDLQIFKWNSDNKLSGKRKDKSRKHDNSSIEEQHYGISPLLQNQNHLWWCCQGHAPWFLSKI
ncbi:PREDICTED: uncharacterized protein LOC105978181 isoform X2 [Erythranthe guttata]|uniref:uncharacterized protein LOC105978181 isoform X2 n=1 Tax=Erythranthe guttata TaxID=4155 RepID=UPI00064E0FDD|nr:PREDICTED: uncharacterized protein LOC105978181 isoform X2 [Erythranthe guttata]|eukprot:XP_012859068.1 PREDICTED: uncharacterized protein LOC105978181 isoform X2 [Erythranthe guttata]